ncbi:sensor histidine kinase [Sphaerisporangium fuscum]|uniref:sensor histidine kinase n=1 Tax=Sphaerisporangium fuscum TaxID=2835868 RepID=UPI001BDCDDD2|nr:histidine kinase [Sphaerisporangium fuscum]
MARDFMPPQRFTALLLATIGLWCTLKALQLILYLPPGPRLAPWAHTEGPALGSVALALTCGLQFAIILRRLPRAARLSAVLVQVMIAYGLTLVYGAPWGPYAALPTASVLLVFTGRTSWILAGCLALGEAVIKKVLGLGWDESAWTVLATGTTALAFFAVARLARLAQDLQRTRAEAAGLEVARERLRIARDLSAALGGRLTQVLVALRRAATDLDPARLADATGTARAALSDVRSVADDYRDRSLTAEVEAARTVLRTAGTTVTVRAAPVTLPAAIDAALAAVLRRTVVTVLRRGTPEQCRIHLDGSARLRVTFTGPPPDAPGHEWSDGLADALRETAVEIGDLGGHLEVDSGVEAWIPIGKRRGMARSPGPVGAAPWLAFAVLLLIEIDYLATSALDIAHSVENGTGSLTPAQILAAAVLVPPISLLQLRHVYPRPGGAPPRAWQVTVPLQIVLLLLALIVVGPAVPASYASLVGGVVLYQLRPPWSWLATVFLLVGAVEIAWGWAPLISQVNALLFTPAFLIPVYALCVLPVMLARLEEARREVTRLAVVKERLRIARDVHDLLGFQLSALVLKGELAGRVMAADPDAGRAQLTELTGLAEHALASLRSITGERADLHLDEEVTAARSMLAAAGIEARVDLAAPIPPGLGGVLAIVLREAVTNVVRHSHARLCSIEASRDGGTYRLRVANDGVRPAGGERSGTGLANLRSRAEEAGGRLLVRNGPDRFSLTAEFPETPAADRAGAATAA